MLSIGAINIKGSPKMNDFKVDNLVLLANSSHDAVGKILTIGEKGCVVSWSEKLNIKNYKVDPKCGSHIMPMKFSILKLSDSN